LLSVELTRLVDQPGRLATKPPVPTELPRESTIAFSAFLEPFLGGVARADFVAELQRLALPA